MRSFVAELQRRNVIRAGAFYAASGWLLVQVATQVFPLFSVPNWAVRWVIVAAVVGFPFMLVFAWFYEFTAQCAGLPSRTTDTNRARRDRQIAYGFIDCARKEASNNVIGATRFRDARRRPDCTCRA